MVASGLELSKLSTPVKQVCSSSSVMSASCKMAKIAGFAALIIYSNTPPKCSAAGGFQYHSMPLLLCGEFVLGPIPQLILEFLCLQ